MDNFNFINFLNILLLIKSIYGLPDGMVSCAWGHSHKRVSFGPIFVYVFLRFVYLYHSEFNTYLFT